MSYLTVVLHPTYLHSSLSQFKQRSIPAYDGLVKWVVIDELHLVSVWAKDI
jgi:hypothetical protein